MSRKGLKEKISIVEYFMTELKQKKQKKTWAYSRSDL
jgi:hypothetical protein